MQCHRLALHAVCRASNAYDPLRALRCAFGTAASRRDHDDRVPSAWEPTEWEELDMRRQQHETTDSKHAEPNPEHEAGATVAERTNPHPIHDATKEEARHGHRQAKGNKSAGTKRGSPLASHLRLLARTKDAMRNRVPSSDMAAEDLWLPCARGQNRIPPEKSKDFMGRLIRLSRALQREKQHAGQLSAHEQQLIEIVFDYAPNVVQPCEPTIQGQVPPPPWETHGKKNRFSILRGLAYAEHELEHVIARFVNFIQPTPLERFARRAATEEVMSLIDQTLHQHGHLKVTTQLQGSEKTGLAMPTSDIDIRVWEQTEEGAPNEPSQSMGKKMAEYMRPIVRALSENPERYHMITLRQGKHPIIDFQHRPSGLNFQIVASKHSDGQERVVEKYLSEMPELRALYTVIRTFFDVRGLLRVNNGGIGSYGCFVMLVPPILREKPRAAERVVGSLRSFLAFYNPTRSLDTTKYGVSCFPRQIFKKHDADSELDTFMQYAERRGDLVRAGQWSICRRQKYQPYLLALQDPATPNNDLGSRTHAIKHILATIAHMQTQIRLWSYGAYRNDRQSHRPILETLVGRPDLLYREQRQILAHYGRAVRDGKVPSSPTRDAIVRAPDSGLQRESVELDTPESARGQAAGPAATGCAEHEDQISTSQLIRRVKIAAVTKSTSQASEDDT
ncbi:hypothetical protein CERZMDRAFT_96466 [Cercospora zeae-maydis SCOH1-5]|uniref:Polynucleotide adenylyltransferase n=1 Tax=Cercospora zeae-maydis SCOH1-5 TaxID=717836 RepID=A0A6A6FJL4_9PEZI|nr:hypothetical protein CERZMDRAFT_96466 [Cercospora zeae-maydis SCOH1-5]